MASPERFLELNDTGPLEEISRLKSFLERTVKGQARAINSVCKVYEYELTLRWLEERRRPIGVFMFLGPSGVGKTELTRMLSQYFMGSVDAMVKIDCSAFSQPHMIHTLIGAPHSYVGWDSPPLLSEKNLFKNLKEPKKSKEHELIENQEKVLLEKIKNLDAQMNELENDFDIKKKFSEALIQYHYVLHGNPDEASDKIESVADVLKDSKARGTVLSMLSKDARVILDNNLATSIEDAAILLDMIVEIMSIILTYRKVEMKKNILKLKLFNLNQEPKRISPNQEDQVEQKEVHRRKMVILFDEIEKGSQALHNLLLQIMEDGRLTLANGIVTDLSNAFIVMTSNVGSSVIGGLLKDKKMGFTASNKQKSGLSEEDSSFENLEKRILQVAEREMEKTFSSAFRGRIDETVVFRPLTRQAFYEILDYQIDLFAEGLNMMKIDLVVDQDVRDMIIAQSFHRPEVGARLLDHKFKSLIKIPLGRLLSKKKDVKGIINVSKGSDDKIKFSIQH